MKTSNIQPPTRSTNLMTHYIEKMVLGKNSESPKAELPRAQTGLEVHNLLVGLPYDASVTLCGGQKNDCRSGNWHLDIRLFTPKVRLSSLQKWGEL